MSNAYAEALASYLDPANPERTQTALARAIKGTQASISRYASGHYLPNAATAREIEKATSGHVPFAVWQSAAARKFGITQ